MELSTPYNQSLHEAALGFGGLQNDTGHPRSHPMDDALHDQREFRDKLILQCFTSKSGPLKGSLRPKA